MTGDESLHVGLVLGWFPPQETYGGIVRYVVDLCDGLQALGHRVTVVTRTSGRRSTDLRGNAEVVRIRMPALGGPVGELVSSLEATRRYRRELARLHADDPFDVIEFSNYAFEGLWHAVRPVAPHATRV